MDFTFRTYKKLLYALIKADYSFKTFSDFLKKPEKKVILLRHDVEARYSNALKFAKTQYENQIRGTYYFRFLKNHYDAEIIKEIAHMDHEIGYHYDDLSYCKGDYKKAIERFQNNLNTLRKIAPVHTICMEGAPISKFDNRNLWNKYKFEDFKIIGEPYFDLDFKKMFYLTDTGRSWSGKFSVRDKTNMNEHNNYLVFRTTNDIIAAIKNGSLHNNGMITFHPQRWNDDIFPWAKELIFQNIKNQIKKILIKSR